MIFFIIYLGQAFQCVKGNGCTPVPYEAIAYMIQFGFLEFVAEIGGLAFYFTTRKRRK